MALTENGIRTRLAKVQGALSGKYYVYAVKLAEEIPQNSENLAFWKACDDLFMLYRDESQRALECSIVIHQHLIDVYIDSGSLEMARWLLQSVEQDIAGDRISPAMAVSLKKTSERLSRSILDLKRRN